MQWRTKPARPVPGPHEVELHSLLARSNYPHRSAWTPEALAECVALIGESGGPAAAAWFFPADNVLEMHVASLPEVRGKWVSLKCLRALYALVDDTKTAIVARTTDPAHAGFLARLGFRPASNHTYILE
jgi:hypothetical protein